MVGIKDGIKRPQYEVFESIDSLPQYTRSRREASLIASDCSAWRVEACREKEGLTLADTCCSHYSNPIPEGIAEEEGWIGEERSISDRYSNTIRLVDTVNR